MSKAAFRRMLRERRAEPLGSSRQREHERATITTPTVYTPPTDEQLVNFATAMVNGLATEIGFGFTTETLTRALFAAQPDVKAGWLERHRQMQREVRG